MGKWYVRDGIISIKRGKLWLRERDADDRATGNHYCEKQR